MKVINWIFDGPYSYLDNFYTGAPIRFGGRTYHTTEHAFQAFKASNLDDHLRVMNTDTPGEAKHLGRSIPLRSDWDAEDGESPPVKLKVMRHVVFQKFKQYPKLAERLSSIPTDVKIVEGNTWHDNVWGACFCSSCRGEIARNWLGQVLMECREALRSGGLDQLPLFADRTPLDLGANLGELAGIRTMKPVEGK